VPIAVLLEIPGCTLEQYREVIERVGLAAPALRRPEGLLVHTGGPMDGGWRVFDVWEAREPYERFAAAHVRPAVQAAGVPQFTPQVYPLEKFVA
jgi:hypothetical protein